MFLAEPLGERAVLQRIYRRHLQLIADRTVQRLRFQEVIGIHGLRRACETVDDFRHHGCGHRDRVQKRAHAETLIRIWNVAAQEQRRSIDGTAGSDVALGSDRYRIRRMRSPCSSSASQKRPMIELPPIVKRSARQCVRASRHAAARPGSS